MEKEKFEKIGFVGKDGVMLVRLSGEVSMGEDPASEQPVVFIEFDDHEEGVGRLTSMLQWARVAESGVDE